MRKFVVALLSIFIINMPAAYANDFEEGFDLGVEAMQSVVAVCFAELSYVLRGYDLQLLGDEAEAALKEAADAHPVVINAYRKGLNLSSLKDPSLKEGFMKCIDQRLQGILN